MTIACSFCKDPQKLRTLLFWLYGILIIVDILIPIVGLMVALFIFSFPKRPVSSVIDAHLTWLRKTLLIYIIFLGFSLLMIIFSTSTLLTSTAIAVFLIGYFWSEWREILGFIFLWQNKEIF